MAAIDFGFGLNQAPTYTLPTFPSASGLSFGGATPAASPALGFGGLGSAQPGAFTMPTPANIAVPAPVAAPAVAAPSVPAAMGWDGVRPMARPDNIVQAAAEGETPGGEGWFDQIGGLEGIGSIANVLGQIGNIWGAFQGVRMARDQLNFARDAYNTNIGNQTQSYNTALEDRIRARTHYSGGSEADVDAYLSRHALPDRRV